MTRSELFGKKNFAAASRGRLRVQDAMEVSETIVPAVMAPLGKSIMRIFVENYQKSGVKHIVLLMSRDFCYQNICTLMSRTHS